MRISRASTIVILAAVAFLSLGLARPTLAQDRSPWGTFPVADAGPGKRAHAASKDAKPASLTFMDEETTWLLPPSPPPETFETAGILQCVPYARFMSGIGIRGDAWTWWDKAAGIYARGNQPEPGAVLSFPGTERMPLGHVAVVTQVMTARKILVDHANWPNALILHGAISRDVQVVDVSPANDWSEVRVQFGEGGPLGSIYPANGFIYEWNEAGVRIAQPRFSLDYALWSPGVASWRAFNSISYLWALPPAERKKAYAAAGMIPDAASPSRGRSTLVLGPVGPGLNASALGGVLGVNRLDVGSRGRSMGGFVIR
jgi:CHAP domain